MQCTKRQGEKMKISLFILCVAIFQGLPLSAQPSKTQHPQSQPWLKDQDDETDTYAIPSDTSEQEEKDEEENLQKLQKKRQKAH
jgi:hypothetical protein